MSSCVQGGHEQVAAGYILYGSSTMLVYTTGPSVNGFTYDSSIGEFILSHPNIKSPANGAIYSCNDAYLDEYSEPIQKYLTACRAKKYSARYIGSLVADFHRNLLKGGIYLYPPTTKSPDGKLRLLYECYPLAFIAGIAGCLAMNDTEAILNIQPQSLHQRTPFYIGAPTMVKELMKLLEE